MIKSEFIPLTAQSALEHVKQSHVKQMYFLRDNDMLRLSDAHLEFDDAFKVQFFLKIDKE